MKHLLLSLSVLICLIFQSGVSVDHSIAATKKASNKLIFLFNEPTQEYDVAFTFVNRIVSNCNTLLTLGDSSVLNANKEALNQEKFYDAIILSTGERDKAIKFKDKSKNNSECRCEKQGGKLVFLFCEPSSEYDIVMKLDVAGAGQQLLLGTCPTIQEKVDKMMRKVEKKKLEYDAIIYGTSSAEALAVKFK